MNLREYLFRQRITVKDFALQTGCTRCHMSLIVNGHLKPSRKLAENIVEASEGEVTLQDLGFKYKLA